MQFSEEKTSPRLAVKGSNSGGAILQSKHLKFPGRVNWHHLKSLKPVGSFLYIRMTSSHSGGANSAIDVLKIPQGLTSVPHCTARREELWAVPMYAGAVSYARYISWNWLNSFTLTSASPDYRKKKRTQHKADAYPSFFCVPKSQNTKQT